MDGSFPGISPSGLCGLGIELPALAEVRIALTGGRGGGKFHVPHSDLRRYPSGGCRYAKPASEASTYQLFEVFDQVCKKCMIVLPDAPDALWRAAAFAAHRRDVVERALADREPRTWLGYARHAARHQPGDDEQFGHWLEAARADEDLAGDAAVLAGAWEQLASDQRAFLDSYAAQCPEVEAFNGARDAVKRCADTVQRRALDQVTAAVGGASRKRARMYEPAPKLDVWTLVCGVWLAARSRGHSAARAAEVAVAAAGRELAGTRVVDVTRLPEPPRTPGGVHASPAPWADAELTLWWPAAVAEMCATLEEQFEAESADASSRLLLVRDWPLTGTRDAPVAYLAASRVLGPVVPHGYRRVDDYVSWSGGDAAGPSYCAVVAAPAHLVAKLEKEQAAQPAHHEARFTASGPVTGSAADLEAAEDLLRAAFPFLPGDGDGEPPAPGPAVDGQRRARQAARGLTPPSGDEDHLYRVADTLRDGYRYWVPDGPDELELLEEMASWLRWSVLRVDVLCGRTGAEKSWASLFGTLESVGSAGIGLNPGGQHRTLRIPLHRIAALTGAPHWDRSHHAPPLWQPYEPLAPAAAARAGSTSGGLRAVPAPDGAR